LGLGYEERAQEDDDDKDMNLDQAQVRVRFRELMSGGRCAHRVDPVGCCGEDARHRARGLEREWHWQRRL
jgi:hypothetical protein